MIPSRLLLLAPLLGAFSAPFLEAQMSWEKLDILRSRHHAAAAYDWERKRVVVFGGAERSAFLGDTLEWDGVRWHKIRPTTSPPPRAYHAMAYDANRKRVVLFGGGSTAIFNDTWEWDGTNWTRRSPSTSPPPRHTLAMAYDPQRKQVVLFGGARGYQHFADTWLWDGTNWNKPNLTTSPPARQGHAMAFDVFRGRVVLHGGATRRPAVNTFGDTWEWDGAAWTQMATTGPNRFEHGMATSLVNVGVVIYGGLDSAVRNTTDAWSWTGRVWTAIPTTNTPDGRAGHSMVFDAARGHVLAIAGSLDDVYDHATSAVWELNNRAWTLGTAAAHPPAPAALASRGGGALSFGGWNSLFLDQTWEWNGAAWQRLFPATTPPARLAQAMVYDEARDRIVMFGGWRNNAKAALGDTWEWDGRDWKAVNPVNKPVARALMAYAYDAHRERVVIFGGSDRFGRRSDTWEFDGTNWTQPSLRYNPPGRTGASMTYDRRRRVIVLFLNQTVANSGETWELNGVTWTRRLTTTVPELQVTHEITFDAARERVVLVGNAARDQTWEYDGINWSKATSPTGGPPGKLAYDSVREQIMMLDYYAHTWVYRNQQPAKLTPFGSGCPGEAGVPRLALDDNRRPWIGETFRVVISDVAPNAPLTLVTGVSRTTWRNAPLPLDLTPLGMPGCRLFTSIDVVSQLVAQQGRATWSARVPADTTLLGLRVYQQAFARDPVANALGLIASNGAEARIGRR